MRSAVMALALAATLGIAACGGGGGGGGDEGFSNDEILQATGGTVNTDQLEPSIDFAGGGAFCTADAVSFGDENSDEEKIDAILLNSPDEVASAKPTELGDAAPVTSSDGSVGVLFVSPPSPDCSASVQQGLDKLTAGA
jgi:hypothetical protein